MVSQEFKNDIRHPDFAPDRGLSSTEMGIMAGILGILIAVTILGNILVILSFITDRKLWLFQNWFILSLGVADGLVGAAIMPLTLVYDMTGQWKFGAVMCKAWQYLDAVCCSSSILNLCAISVARYWSVSKPLEYALHMQSSGRAAFMISLVWIISLVANLPLLVGWAWDDSPPPGPLQCQIVHHVGYIVYTALATFFVPVTIMLFVTIAIRDAMRQRRRRVFAAGAAVLRVVEATSRMSRATVMRKDGISGGARGNRKGGESVIVRSTGGSLKIEATAGPSQDIDPTDQTAECLEMKTLAQSSETRAKYGSCATDPFRKTPSAKASVVSETGQAAQCATVSCGPSDDTDRVNNNSRITTGAPGAAIASSKSHHLSNRVTRTLAVVVFFFVLCWTPFYVVYLLGPLCSTCHLHPDLITVCIWLGYFNSTLNPLLYAAMNKNFRADFKRILTCRILGPG